MLTGSNSPANRCARNAGANRRTRRWSENPASVAKATRRAAGAEKTGVATVSMHSSEARLGHDHLVIKPIYEKKNARLEWPPPTSSGKTTRVVVPVMRAI